MRNCSIRKKAYEIVQTDNLHAKEITFVLKGEKEKEKIPCFFLLDIVLKILVCVTALMNNICCE